MWHKSNDRPILIFDNRFEDSSNSQGTFSTGKGHLPSEASHNSIRFSAVAAIIISLACVYQASCLHIFLRDIHPTLVDTCNIFYYLQLNVFCSRLGESSTLPDGFVSDIDYHGNQTASWHSKSDSGAM